MIWSLCANCGGKKKSENFLQKLAGDWRNTSRILKDAFSLLGGVSGRAGGCGSLQVDPTQVLVGHRGGLGAGAGSYDE